MSVKLIDGSKSVDLQYKILKSGNSSGVSPTMNDKVVVNYEGRSIDGRIFDSSYQRGNPITLSLGGVIQGWQAGLQAMKPGDVWEFYMPSELGYGTAGSGPAVGPNEALIFKIELISVVNKTDKTGIATK